MRVGVLASGRGSNLQALLDAFPAGHERVSIVVVISNRPECAALERARAAGVEARAFDTERFPRREERHAAIAACLAEHAVELVVLAGYDQIVPPALLNAFSCRVINVHPSLLPAFAGTLHAQRDALQHGVKVSGCTVHFVTEEVDGGPIIAQAAVPVRDDDDLQRLADRILVQEHRLLPEVVRWFAAGRIRLEGRHVIVQGQTD